MSKDKDDDKGKVEDKAKESNRVPPKEHQFKKGQSGNPNGRPRKPRRAHIPSQIAKDVLKISDKLITIGGEEMTMMQAYFFALINNAIRGKALAMRLYNELLIGSLHDNVMQNPEFKLIDTLEKKMLSQGVEMNKGMQDFLDDLAKRSRNPD